MSVFQYLIITITLCLAKFLWNIRRLVYYGSKIPGPSIIRIIKESRRKRKGTMQFISDNFKKYGDIYKIQIGCFLMIATNNPNYIKTVLTNCLEKHPTYRFAKVLIAEGLFSASGQKWKRKRKTMAPIFNQKVINSFFDIFHQNSLKLLDKFDPHVGTYFNVLPTIQQSTLDNICETSLGVKIKAMDTEHKYSVWMNRGESLIFKRFYSIHLHPDITWRITKWYKELSQISHKSWHFVKKIIEKKRAENNHSNKTKCLIDLLTAISPEISNEELNEEAQTLVLAGSQTTATAEATTLLLLGLHQDIQLKVHQELDGIFGTTDRPLAIDDLKNMPYLDRVIKESMRIIPVAPIFMRKTYTDLKFAETVVPKGAAMVVSVIHLHRNPELWPNPMVFDPDRFLPDQVAERHPYAYIPFGGGPRNCIGMRYAFISIKIMLATVLRRFRVASADYASIDDIKLRPLIVTQFPKGHRVKLEHRQSVEQNVS